MWLRMEGVRLKDRILSFLKYIFFGKDLLSDLLFILFAIIFFYFIFYPALQFILKTPYPIVIVLTNSMEHKNFDINWYIKHGVIKNASDWYKFPFPNGINVGDIIIVKGDVNYSIGDVAVYISPLGLPIVHRIINKTCNKECYYTFKGDNSLNPLPWERKVPQNKVVGKVIFRIPYLGLPKVLVVKLLCIMNPRIFPYCNLILNSMTNQ